MAAWLAPAFGLAKGVLGFLGAKNQVKRQNALEMQKFVRLRDAAEAGGFHPLEALRSGAEVNAEAAPRLMSTLARSNAFDALESELTGEAAKDRRRAEVDDEIRERELEIMRHRAANEMVTSATVVTNRPPRVGGNDPRFKVEVDVPAADESPLFIDEEHDVAETPIEPIVKPFTAPDGTVMPLVEDWDQALQALIMYGPARLTRDYRQHFESARKDPKEVYALIENFRRNNPEMSEGDIRAHVKSMLGL